MKNSRKIYTREFMDSTVQMVHTSGKSAAEVARELGLPEWRVGTWVRAARKASGTNGGSSNNAEQELQKLKREYKRLQEENEILKKAAAFFAQHQR